MAGPGGGGHGGGGAGGSFGGGRGGGGRGGGGFGGGGFGGRPPHHHHHFHGGFFWGPRFFFGPPIFFGGGLLGILLFPIIILLILAIFISILFGSAISSVAAGGSVNYNEEAFQDYANSKYYEEFDSEDCIMVVMLTGEDNNGYYYIGWVGDNIRNDINRLFGNEYTKLGQAISRNINSTNYKYSLSQNLAMVADDMTAAVKNLNLSSSFKRDTVTVRKNALLNYTTLSISPETVESALSEFYDETGIPIAIVVDEAEDVFGRTLPWVDIIICLVLLAIAIYIIYVTVKAIKNRKRANTDGYNGNSRNNNGYGGYNGYNNNAFDNYNDFNT